MSLRASLQTARVVDPEQWPQATYPLGANPCGDDVSFAVYSRRATRVELELYADAMGSAPVLTCSLQQNPVDHVWRAKISGVPQGTLYGFRCWGPNWPWQPGWQRGGSNVGFLSDFDAAGNRFNPNKLLFDPYARELSHDRETPESLARGDTIEAFSTGPLPYRGRPSREFDTALVAPKGLYLRLPASDPALRPRIPTERAFVYEAHLRGLSRHPSATELGRLLRGVSGFESVVGVPARLRGTYAGAAYLAPYLKALGITTLELMPVFESENALCRTDAPGGNYWGYMTMGYFAPDRRYAHDRSPGGPTREFQAMVKAFHAAGLEVYLDVVYNHTGEGGNWRGRVDTTGFVCLGGFDAVEYYLHSTEGQVVEGATGCGNQINSRSPIAQRLVMDSLAYWVEQFGIDGFRFDLAPVLGRGDGTTPQDHSILSHRFHRDHPLLAAIIALGHRHDVEMIAEAWDLWSYEVGNFPSGWSEWNGRYRDAVRRFMAGAGNALDFCQMLDGDPLHHAGRGGPHRSINFVVAHDGFTLLDLVSYRKKSNDGAWPFGPSDGGSDDNLSMDCEGSHEVRRRKLRNFWLTLCISRGVPMVVAGDEFGRTQNGNNNPWCIDSVGTWTNYAMLGTSAPTRLPTEGGGAYHDNFGLAAGSPDRNPLFRFVAALTRLRQGRVTFAQTAYGEASPTSVQYLFTREDGVSHPGDGNRCLRLYITGSRVGEQDLLVLFNLWTDSVEFQLPALSDGRCWRRRIDTSSVAEADNNLFDLSEPESLASSYRVAADSVVLLVAVAPVPSGQ